MSKGSESVKRTRKRLRDGILEAFESKCGLCGYKKYSGALELHHLDPNQKDFEFGDNTTRSFKFLCSEAIKCALLCSNCHREVHIGLSIIPTDILKFDETKITYKPYDSIRRPLGQLS